MFPPFICGPLFRIFLEWGFLLKIFFLHHGDKLDKVKVFLQEIINIQRILCAYIRYTNEGIVIHIVLSEVFYPLHNAGEGTPARAVHSVTVVDILRAVDAYADQEIVFFEELCPFRIYQCGVGLKGVCYFLARPFIFPL